MCIGPEPLKKHCSYQPEACFGRDRLCEGSRRIWQGVYDARLKDISIGEALRGSRVGDFGWELHGQEAIDVFHPAMKHCGIV